MPLFLVAMYLATSSFLLLVVVRLFLVAMHLARFLPLVANALVPSAMHLAKLSSQAHVFLCCGLDTQCLHGMNQPPAPLWVGMGGCLEHSGAPLHGMNLASKAHHLEVAPSNWRDSASSQSFRGTMHHTEVHDL